MNIAVEIQKGEEKNLVNNYPDFPHDDWGWKYAVLNKKPKIFKVSVGRVTNALPLHEKIYFLLEEHIIAYGLVLKAYIVDDEMMIDYSNKLWVYKNKCLIRYKETYWYKEPIPCKKHIEQYHFKYINLKRILKGKPEPEVSKTVWT